MIGIYEYLLILIVVARLRVVSPWSSLSSFSSNDRGMSRRPSFRYKHRTLRTAGRSVVCQLLRLFHLLLATHSQLTYRHAAPAHMVDRCTMAPHNDQILHTTIEVASTLHILDAHITTRHRTNDWRVYVCNGIGYGTSTLFFKYCYNFCSLGRMNRKWKGKRGRKNTKKERKKEERRKDGGFWKSFYEPKKIKSIISEGKALKNQGKL